MLRLKDIHFGSIDAKNELFDNAPQSRQLFRQAFLIPDNVQEERFFSGNKFIVQGLKGTGKTALLRYLAINVQEDYKAHSRFVLFRRDIPEDKRQDLARAANAVEVTTESSERSFRDFEHVWEWLFFRLIIDTLKQHGADTLVDDGAFRRFRSIVLSVKEETQQTGVLRFLPKLKRGEIELKADLGIAEAGVNLEFDFPHGEGHAPFSAVLSQAQAAFGKLTASSKALYLFIDELELTVGRDKLLERDSLMIRDLIVAASRFNELCRQRRIPIYILLAVRSEVLRTVAVYGKEINKLIEDFGIRIAWNTAGNELDHPLLEIITRRINTSEELAGLPRTPASGVWSTFFPREVQRRPVREYILHQTWYRPRDIVRMFNSICEQFPEETRIGHQCFDAIRQTYSADSWTEALEELRTTYTQPMLEGLKRVLTGFKVEFTLDEANNRIEHLRGLAATVDNLAGRKRCADVLSDLYRIGVIGNIRSDPSRRLQTRRPRWSFRGDDEALFDVPFVVHRALWRTLALVG